jgi:O-antigen ligase
VWTTVSARRSRFRRSLALAVGIAALVIAAGASQGAYFSQSWGWVALAFLVPTTLALILGLESAPGRLRLAFASSMLGLGTWIALTSIWSLSPPGSLREVERTIVYIGLALAVTFVLRSTDRASVLAGVLIGTSLVCGYSLATKLAPEHFAIPDPAFENRLAVPLGYPNALGSFASLGALVALAFVAHGRRVRTAALVATLIPPLIAVLYFTFSRGAWAAFVLSLVTALALDRRWLYSLWACSIVAIPSIATVWIASRQHALTSSRFRMSEAVQEGHRLAVALFAFAACSALLAALARLAADRLSISARTTRVLGRVVALAAAVALTATIVAAGGPRAGIARLEAEFKTLPAGAPDLNSRLFTVYGQGRSEIWPVAWHQFRAAPVVGEGAGSFEDAWYENRQTTRIVRDAHSLYLETLGELGLVGFGLLVTALSIPLAAALRARRSRYVPFAAAAYVSWALASAVDWHWEMTALTMTAMLAGSVALLGAAGRATPLTNRLRGLALTITVFLSLFAVVSLVGNQALFAGRADLSRRDWAKARDDAQRARRLLVWSSEPDVVIGDAEAGLGSRAEAASAYRDATAKDPGSWVAWLRLAQVARGAERRSAYAKVHELNPLEHDLPGESSPG